MKKLAILSALALAASFGSANAQMGGGMNQSGMMNQQGTQGGMTNKRMSKKQMIAMKKKQMMMRRKNMSGM
jgi:hypothetical protein